MAIWLGGKKIEAKRVHLPGGSNVPISSIVDDGAEWSVTTLPDGSRDLTRREKIVNDKKKLALCLLFLAWTFFNCIKPPYEGNQLIPAVRRGGGFDGKSITVSPAHYTTVPAGRWFVWNIPDLVVSEGKQPVKITRVNAVSLVTEYAAGVAVIGAVWLVVDWKRRNSQGFLSRRSHEQ